MGVLSDLKSRFARTGADGQYANGEGAADDVRDGFADMDDADDPRRDDRAASEGARGNRPLADLPDIPYGSAGEEEDVPLVSRNDVKRYLRDLEARALDPNYKPDVRPGQESAPANVNQAFSVPPVSVAPVAAPAPASAPAPSVMPVAAPVAAPAPVQPASHPGYAQSAFLGPKAAEADPWRAQAAAAPAMAPAVPVYAAPEALANTGRAIQDASADFLPKDAVPSPLFASDAVTHLPSTSIRELVVVNPGSFEDAEMVSTALRARKQVVITVRQVPDFLSRRILDFAFGAASVAGASVAVIANKIYALTFDAPLNQYEILSLREKGVL